MVAEKLSQVRTGIQTVSKTLVRSRMHGVLRKGNKPTCGLGSWKPKNCSSLHEILQISAIFSDLKEIKRLHPSPSVFEGNLSAWNLKICTLLGKRLVRKTVADKATNSVWIIKSVIGCGMGIESSTLQHEEQRASRIKRRQKPLKNFFKNVRKIMKNYETCKRHISWNAQRKNVEIMRKSVKRPKIHCGEGSARKIDPNR